MLDSSESGARNKKWLQKSRVMARALALRVLHTLCWLHQLAASRIKRGHMQLMGEAYIGRLAERRENREEGSRSEGLLRTLRKLSHAIGASVWGRLVASRRHSLARGHDGGHHRNVGAHNKGSTKASILGQGLQPNRCSSPGR